MIRLVLVLLLAASAFVAQSQDVVEIIRVERPLQAQTSLEGALGELAELVWLDESPQDTLVIRASAGSGYTYESEASAEGDHTEAVSIDVNTWRSLRPDDFVPGPANGVLGAVGLADARSITLSFEGDAVEREFVVQWDRRKDDGVLQRHTVANVVQRDSDSDLEVWELQEISLDWCLRAVARIGIELTDSDTDISSWQRYDRYTRARSSLIRSLSRATTRIAVGVTTDGQIAGIVEFDSAIKPHSVQRAVDRLVLVGDEWLIEEGFKNRTLPGWSFREQRVVPFVCVGQSDEGVVVVIATSVEGAGAVLSSMQPSAAE